MGSNCSKSSSARFRGKGGSNSYSTTMAPHSDMSYNNGDIRVESIQKDDLHNINVIKREFQDNPDVFVLNNLCMSIQFFCDHNEVIKKLQFASASPQEKAMNKTLLKHETMECTYPDAILEEVNKNVVFRTLEEDSKSENLAAKRIYVINDLIEVVKSKEIPQYTSIDKPSYQVRMEDSKRKGFVKLQQVEVTTPRLAGRGVDENFEPVAGPSSCPDDEYEYTTITNLRTPKLLEVDPTVERRDTLPDTCFTLRKVNHLPSDYIDRKDGIEYLEQLSEKDLFKEVTYINSNGFMKYFQNTLFPVSLGKSLGFDEEAIRTAKAIPGKIFCDEMDLDTNIIKSFEVIPAIGIPWPDEQTCEFFFRENRPTIIDTRTGIKYRWPTSGPNGMTEEMRNMSCVLVPKGYAKKRGVNVDASLEWEINFPKAERYLEARMSHAQMKCFLLLLAINKTFIAPVTHQHGLLPEHIRTHMYWECESDYRNWPEHRLGTKILKVIKNIQYRLYLGTLPDFFIKDKDLFENIPKKHLQYAQKVFLDILQSPLPYFIKALMNLRYTSGKFYSPLNLKEIYDDLTTKSIAVLIKHLNAQKPPSSKTRFYKEPDDQLKHLREVKFKEKIWKQRMQKEENERKKKVEELLLKREKGEIDLEMPIDKNLDVDQIKSILATFIKNFIDIAKKSSTIATKDQALFYLKQAFYLTKILEEKCAAYFEEIRELRQTISLEETRIKKTYIRTPSSTSMPEDKPPTPVRNSFSFQYNDVVQQVRSGSIKRNNLQTTYKNGLQTNRPNSNLKSQKGESFKESITRRKTVNFAE